MPVGTNERLLANAGLTVIDVEDTTGDPAQIARTATLALRLHRHEDLRWDVGGTDVLAA